MKLSVLGPCPAPTLLLSLLEGPEVAVNNPCAVQVRITPSVT